MELSAAEISKIVDGKLIGDGVTSIRKVAPIESADDHSLTFLTNPKYNHHLSSTQAPAILVGPSFNVKGANGKTLIVVDEVYAALSEILGKFHPNPDTHNKEGISPHAHITEDAVIGQGNYIGPNVYIASKARIGNNVKIFPHSYIGDSVVVEDNTIIYPGVTLYANTIVGENCILQAGCVIGSDGFGFVPLPDGSFKKIPQTGRVILGNNVEVGANTTIDRATMEATYIQDGVKLDNLIQIGHNVVIGKNTVIAAQTGISGSTHIGRNNQIGGQVGIVGHIKTADGTQIGAKSGVGTDLNEPGKKWHGLPAEPYRLALRNQSLFKKLPEMQAMVKRLENEIEMLKKQLNPGKKEDSGN